MVADTRPIGLFDSGAGGLHVASAVHELLPAERLVYVADTARLPFGPRPPAELRAIAAELAAELLARGAKLVVVAHYNNSSSNKTIDASDKPGSDMFMPTMQYSVEQVRSQPVTDRAPR